jgi:hypothetical protein
MRHYGTLERVAMYSKAHFGGWSSPFNQPVA